MRVEKLVSLDGSRKPLSTSSLGRSTTDDATDADHRLREFLQGLRATLVDGGVHWYDVDSNRPYTLQEIAEIMGVSRERVRQIEEQALRKMWRRLRAMSKRENLNETDWLRIADDYHGEDSTIYMPT
jgi:DNA-directed RNA polymerase sigma subunit (sigma70/sigma32)